MTSVSTVSTVAGSVVTPRVAEPLRAPDRALSQAVSKAVSRLNANGFAGEGREVTISLDPGTHRTVVKVVDTSTREVLQQWPSEYVLRVAEDSKSRDSA